MLFLSNFVKFIFLSLIRLYQILLSPFFGKQCRFNPTCSRYSEEAINKHGSFNGLILTIKRLFKCHPWGTSGHDPVPDRLK